MIIFQDIERTADQTGATIVSHDGDSVTIDIPDLVEFALTFGRENTEWDEEAHYFFASRRPGDVMDRYVFTYPLDDVEE